MHERRIDAGLAGDRADRHRVVAARGERGPRGGEDRRARAVGAGAPAGPARDRSLARHRKSSYDDFMTDAGPAIAIEDLVVRRGGRDVVRVPRLAVPRGRVTGLMGPSGSGKTTLMRSIVGVQRIAAGRIAVLGAPAGSGPLRARVGYMTQAPSVYGDLTVRENLRFFARVLGAGEERVDAVVAAVKVPDRKGQLVRDLSGGERARVSLAAGPLRGPGGALPHQPAPRPRPPLRGGPGRALRPAPRGGAPPLGGGPPPPGGGPPA